MIEKIKSMPGGVKVASVFLLAVYVGMCIVAPPVGLGIAVGLGTILALGRIVDYLMSGE